MTVYLLAFLDLLNATLALNFDAVLADFRSRWDALEGVAAS